MIWLCLLQFLGMIEVVRFLDLAFKRKVAKKPEIIKNNATQSEYWFKTYPQPIPLVCHLSPCLCPSSRQPAGGFSIK